MAQDQDQAKPDARARSGTPSDRQPTGAKALATGSGIGVVLGLAHYTIKCYSDGHWHYITPDDGLIDVLAPTLLLPFGHYCILIMTLIGKIISNWLAKKAGVNPEES